tara:strand:- start:734 stop:1048 length:315 start_codon:yes stop_codon:yes gene_type:complete
MSNQSSHLDFSSCKPVNYLWVDFINMIGVDKATQAVRQSIDLNNMRGGEDTLPVLFTKTGGIALTTFEFIKIQTGLSVGGDNKVLLYRPDKKIIQIINEIKKDK